MTVGPIHHRSREAAVTVPGRSSARPSHGFTLVELVVVILILGLLAAVAAPRFLGTNDLAQENTFRHCLAVVRDAIDRYTAEHGGQLPGDAGDESDFKSDLADYIRRFPENPFKESAQVSVQTTGQPLTFAGGAAGWRYDNRTGQFIANSNGVGSDGLRQWQW